MNPNAISESEKRILQANQCVEEAEARNRVKEQKARTRRLIHEGAAARISIDKTYTEKHGIILDRCELNRKIKADNVLLRRLRAELHNIITTTRTSIPKTAKTMELIFSNLIIYRYNQKQAENVVRQCDE